jgi:hypothetical protein
MRLAARLASRLWAGPLPGQARRSGQIQIDILTTLFLAMIV